MAYRIFAWGLVLLASLECRLQAIRFEEFLGQAHSLRHIILSKDSGLGQEFCKLPIKDLQWQWRENGIWTDVCSTFTDFSTLPRFWKVQATYKYQLLFRWELPITVSIVILA